jgi:hypothetical protein
MGERGHAARDVTFYYYAWWPQHRVLKRNRPSGATQTRLRQTSRRLASSAAVAAYGGEYDPTGASSHGGSGLGAGGGGGSYDAVQLQQLVHQQATLFHVDAFSSFELGACVAAPPQPPAPATDGNHGSGRGAAAAGASSAPSPLDGGAAGRERALAAEHDAALVRAQRREKELRKEAAARAAAVAAGRAPEVRSRFGSSGAPHL